MRSVGKGGSIIITASLACEAAFPELAPYNMSKFAVRALSVTAAQEYAKDKIRVNTVSPGFVNTALVGVWPQLQERLAATPAGKFMATEDSRVSTDMLGFNRQSSGTGRGCKFVLILGKQRCCDGFRKQLSD